MSLDLDLLLDMAKSDVNHPERHLYVERFVYSGEGLGNLFTEGATIYQVSMHLWGSGGNGTTKIEGHSTTFDGALADAVSQLAPWAAGWLKNATERLANEQSDIEHCRRLLKRIQGGKP
jgi:hypothetical protein